MRRSRALQRRSNWDRYSHIRMLTPWIHNGFFVFTRKSSTEVLRWNCLGPVLKNGDVVYELLRQLKHLEPKAFLLLQLIASTFLWIIPNGTCKREASPTALGTNRHDVLWSWNNFRNTMIHGEFQQQRTNINQPNRDNRLPTAWLAPSQGTCCGRGRVSTTHFHDHRKSLWLEMTEYWERHCQCLRVVSNPPNHASTESTVD